MSAPSHTSLGRWMPLALALLLVGLPAQRVRADDPPPSAAPPSQGAVPSETPPSNEQPPQTPAAVQDGQAGAAQGPQGTELEQPVAPRPQLSFEKDVIERENGDIVYFYRTNFATPASLIAALTAMGIAKLPGITGLKEYAAQNQLVVEGEREAVRLLLLALEYFDVAEPQVFIEAKVIEITHESNFEFGLDYLVGGREDGGGDLVRGLTGLLNPPSFLRSQYPPGFPFQGTSLLLGSTGTSLDNVTLQALQVSGKAEVLSRPSIIATQGKPASVMTEEQTPIVTLVQADRNNETVRSAPVQTGVSLTVTPEHIGDKFVRFTLEPIVRGVAGLASIRPGGSFAPITTLRKASTTVTLGDGETLVIGGLYTNQRTTEKARTPVISDIPFLGNLFTRTKETKQKTELLFILTPHIVRKTQDMKLIVPPAELERLEEKEGAGAEGCKSPFKPTWGATFED